MTVLSAAGAAAHDLSSTMRIAYTTKPSIMERLDHAAQVTRTLEIKPSDTTPGKLLSRHTTSAIIPGTGNTELPIGPRLPLPESIKNTARQHVLDAVAQLRDKAPEQLTKPGDPYGYPPRDEVWVNMQPTPGGDPYSEWTGKRYNVNDPGVDNLMHAIGVERLGNSPYDFHGGDGQNMFTDAPAIR